jgi:type I restriction enzyme S subunit
VKQYTTRPVKTCKENDLLLCVRGSTTGRTNVAGFDAAIGRGGAAIRASIEQSYINYYIVSQRDSIFSMGTGSTFPNITTNQLYTLPVPIAPSNEQRRIVVKLEELFSDLDAGVAALERVRSNLRRYRAAVLKAAVEGKLTEDWRAQHPDTEPTSVLLERILTERRRQWEKDQLAKFALEGRQPPMGWKDKYPAPVEVEPNTTYPLVSGWGWASLSQLGELDRGRSRHRPRNAPHLYGGDYPFVQTGDIRHARTFVREFNQTYNESGLAQSRLWRAGTLCITIAANIAETAILGFDACFPDSVVGFLADQSNVSVRYVELYFRTMQSRLESLAPATAQKNINLEVLTSLQVVLPPRAEQEVIVAEVDRRLSIADEIEAQVDADLTRAARLRQGILKLAFEGRLVPQDPNDEPAEAHLERIRQASGQVDGRAAAAIRGLKPRRPARRKGRLDEPSLFD